MKRVENREEVEKKGLIGIKKGEERLRKERKGKKGEKREKGG